jgi:hypothetical protein
MRKFGLWLATVLIPVFSIEASLVGADHGGNYGGSWSTGSNGGTNFGAWAISVSGTAGSFIGDPVTAGIGGMSSSSFGLWANPNGPGNYVNADRPFGGGAMVAGNVFSFLYGVNWDSNGSGNKGFNLYSGGVGGTQLINVNMGGSATITYDVGGGAQTLFSNYGTNAMMFTFTFLSGNQLRLQATGRNGTDSFDQTFNLSGAPDTVRYYASDLDQNDANNRQPYINNLSMSNAIPEPNVLALIGLGIAGMLFIRRFKK